MKSEGSMAQERKHSPAVVLQIGLAAPRFLRTNMDENAHTYLYIYNYFMLCLLILYVCLCVCVRLLLHVYNLS